jgi:predicted HTH domain antitoxin
MLRRPAERNFVLGPCFLYALPVIALRKPTVRSRSSPRNYVGIRFLSTGYLGVLQIQAPLWRLKARHGAKLLLAAKLFELGRLSSGKAAELCGMGRVEFLLALPRVGVSLSNLGPEDADDEAAFANRT